MGNLRTLSIWRLCHCSTRGERNAMIAKTESPRRVEEPRKDKKTIHPDIRVCFSL